MYHATSLCSKQHPIAYAIGVNLDLCKIHTKRISNVDVVPSKTLSHGIWVCILVAIVVAHCNKDK